MTYQNKQQYPNILTTPVHINAKKTNVTIYNWQNRRPNSVYIHSSDINNQPATYKGNKPNYKANIMTYQNKQQYLYILTTPAHTITLRTTPNQSQKK